MIDLTGTSVEVAPALLGTVIEHDGVAIELTEVEAYEGERDPAAHAFGGPRPSTKDLFGSPGTLYCYLSHGIHTCANVVCAETGVGSAVLLRAGRVVAGAELARRRRGPVPDERLARGPGCLGQALGFSLTDSGRMFGEPGLVLRVGSPPAAITHGPRVGVSVAHQRPWRFWVPGDPTVSAYRRSPRARSDRLAW